MDREFVKQKVMRVGSLFAGIGGFELAAQWAGFTPIWSNEIDPFCCKVLRKNFTHRIIEDDIRNIGKQNLEPVDLITGGFPCQPFSVAGRRKGKDDDRFLWPEMLRVIHDIEPKFIVGENVGGSEWMVDEICTNLESIGYTAEPINIESACVGSDHFRERYWFMAYSNSLRLQRSQLWVSEDQGERNFDAAILSALPFQFPESKNYIPKPYVIGGAHGVSDRAHRTKALGNAIVPQVAYEIFQVIKAVNF